MMRIVVPEFHEEEHEAVARVLRSGMLVQGEAVREFEARVAEFLGASEAIAVSSGTAALHLALLAAGIGPGDEVILPDFTFPATANVVERIGAVPVLVDIDLETFNIDPSAAEKAVTARTKALMPVHLFGLSADMDAMASIAKEHGLVIIEDAACALGSQYGGRSCGTIGEFGCFSFHPRKVITTGEGGMIVTANRDAADQLRRLRAHGMASRNGRIEFVEAGLNYRLTEMQGALGVAQMRRLELILARRAELARTYSDALQNVRGLTLPRATPGSVHSWQAYVVLLKDKNARNAALDALRRAGIEATIGTHAVSMQPHVGGRVTRVPRSQCAFESSVALPLYPRLAADDVRFVARTLIEALGH